MAFALGKDKVYGITKYPLRKKCTLSKYVPRLKKIAEIASHDKNVIYLGLFI